MTAVLKKRALAEYSQVQVQEVAVTQQPPFKKLRLVKKLTASGSSAIAFVNMLEKCKNSTEALQTLLRVSDRMDFEGGQIPEAIRKLSEHYRTESESAVRVKVLSLFADIGRTDGADAAAIIEETLTLMKKENSRKVVAQALSTVAKLGERAGDGHGYQWKLIEAAKSQLRQASHSIKCRALELMGALLPSGGDSDSVCALVSRYFKHEDARVRGQAFATTIALHERGFRVDPAIYSDACTALSDDYEIVREAALKVVWILGTSHSELPAALGESEQEIRLIDDAFGKVCHAVNDLSMSVRASACRLLGSMRQVSPRFLHQTLDKKLMSNMRKKRSAHERAWENVTSGEWASGKKWADDAPREFVDADSISLMSSGACGAFVHGLEDEYMEVRSAAVDSLCMLSLEDAGFAAVALDFLVDMFNDEIEDVRLRAIDSLRRISGSVVLREDQLETVLGALEDCSGGVREGLYRMLAACRLATTACLRLCVDKLLDNLRRYPQDKRSVYWCARRLGQCHPELTLPLLPALLGAHPFFDTAEPDADTPAYVCVLVLALNAARECPSALESLGQHALRHHSYLRDTMPSLVPPLEGRRSPAVAAPTESAGFLNAIVSGLSSGGPKRVRTALLQAARHHLDRLADMDGAVAGAARFTATYIDAQLLAATPGAAAASRLLAACHKLDHLFVGLVDVDVCAVKQLRLRALAAHLLSAVRASNASALAPCHHFLAAAEEAERALRERNVQPDPLTAAVFRELASLDELKPGPVARCLVPLLREGSSFIPPPPPPPNLAIRMTRAFILEPQGGNDSALKFTAGLVMAVPLEAELIALAEPSRLRVRVKYPDQRTCVLVPRPADLRPLDLDSDGSDLRLLTTVLISHQVWTEACYVDVGLALSVPEADVARRRPQLDSPACLLDLCKPVKIYVAPKPVKKGIL